MTDVGMEGGSGLDFSEWEGCKENIVPLKQGRDPRTLVLLCKGNVDLDEQRREHEERIKNLDGKDPLDVWESYIEWAQQTDLTGSEVLQLLERCTQQLKELRIYNDELRFLHLWLALASYNDDPIDVFNFMNTNEIGTMYGLFYEEWAIALETRGNSAQADKVYEMGIRKGAQPLERLRKCHRRFQRRLIESIQKTVNDPSAAAATARAPASKTSRAPLGRLSRPSQRATSIAASSTGGKTSASRGSTSSRQTKVTVYEEPSADDENAPTATWNRLPTRVERTKENNPIPAKWSDATLPQKKTAKKPERPSFVIYEEPTPDPTPAAAPVKPPNPVPPRV